MYKRLVIWGIANTQIEREVGEDVMERAKVFQIWLSGCRARFVKQKLGRDLGTASYIYIYLGLKQTLTSFFSGFIGEGVFNVLGYVFLTFFLSF